MKFYKEEVIIYKIYADVHDEDGITHRGMLINTYDNRETAKEKYTELSKLDWLSNLEICEEVV